MANYQGLNCIMGEITMMASNEKNPIHEQHIYDYTYNSIRKTSKRHRGLKRGQSLAGLTYHFRLFS